MNLLQKSIACLALALSASTLAADTLVFKNGDRLTGSLVSQENGVITFSSPVLGTLQVAEADAEVQTPENVSEEVAGPTMPSEGTQMADAAGAPETVESGETETAAAEQQAEDWDARIAEWKEAFQSVIPEGWHGKFTVGYTYTNSNSRKTAFVTKFNAKLDDDIHHYGIRGFYEFGDTVNANGVKSVDTDKYGGGFNYKWDFEEDWFFTSDTSYLKDQVRDIEDQATETLGVGYRIINDEDMKLNITGGMSGQYNNVVGENQKWFYYVTAGNEFEYHFNKYFRVEQNAYIRMDPSDTNNYQYNFYLGGVVKLTEWIEASLSYNANYDNIVGPGTKKLEENIIFALGVPF